MIKKNNGKFLVQDSSGKRTLGEHESRKDALRQLRAIEASKHSNYADGGSKPMTPQEELALKEKFAIVEPSKKKTFTPEEVLALKNKFSEMQARDPKLALMANDIANRKHSSNPLLQNATNMNADLKNLNAVIPGANPPLDQPQLVSGTREVINDINKVPGGKSLPLPEKVTKFKSPVDRIDTSGMRMGKVDDYTKRVAERAAESASRDAQKRVEKASKMAALRGLKTGSKKLLSAIPLVGGLVSALSSGDASAAMPMGFDSEEVGAPANTVEGKMERGERLSPEDQAILEQRIQALEALRRR